VSARLKLAVPIEVGGVGYSELRIGRVTLRDAARSLGGTDAENAVALAAKLCRVEPDVIRSLHEVDLGSLIEAIEVRLTEARSA
jgi:hypothetical protein